MGKSLSVTAHQPAMSSISTCRVGGAAIRRAEQGFAEIVSSIRIAVFMRALNTRIAPPALVLPRLSFNSS